MSAVRLSGLLFCALLLPGGPLSAQCTTWEVASASVTFEIRNAGLPVHGSFGGIEADLCFDPDRPAAGRFTAFLDPTTIDTGIGLRDRHLHRRDWFHVERFGPIEMRSVRLWKVNAGFSGTFVLRIRDVEREVEIPFAFTDFGREARISGSLTLDRREYGVGKRSRILSDEVTVHVVLDLTRGIPARR